MKVRTSTCTYSSIQLFCKKSSKSSQIRPFNFVPYQINKIVLSRHARRGIGVNTTRDESDLSFHHSRQQYKGLGNGVATLATSATFSLWWKS